MWSSQGQPLILTATLTPAAVGANTTAEQTFTVNGLEVGMIVHVIKPTVQAGIAVVGARVSAANTLAIAYGNWTGGGITPTAAERYRVIAFRTW
jgi:hypothetical protein